MNKSICLHAIDAFHNRYNSRETLSILKHILNDDALLSARLQNKKYGHGFNGIDYISLCDYEKRKFYHEGYPEYTAFRGYIMESLSIVFPKDKLPIITPQIIDICTKRREGITLMTMLGLSEDERYSDMYDEVQVKDKISLELMSGITLPIHKMRKPFQNEQKTIDLVLKEVEKICNLLALYGYEVPIYDINTFYSLKSSDNVKRLIRQMYKKRD